MIESPSNLVVLSGLSPFGRGGKRDCYVDPRDPDRCIKVAKVGLEPERLLAAAPWWARWRKTADDFDKNYRDWEMLHRLDFQSKTAALSFLPQCFGWVETDRGRGLAIEMIRDHDGLISRSFKDYLWTEGYNSRAQWAVEQLVQQMRQCPLATRTLVLYNFATQVRADGSLRLVFIDGMGATELIPLSRWSTRIASWKTERKIRHLLQQIKDLTAQRERGEDPGRWGFLLSRR